jgi:copper oxidase (laccase) domain-containing protein
LEKQYRCAASSLLVAFGPCIGKDCYEVGYDVKKTFEERGLTHDVFNPHPSHAGKFCLDLRMANKLQLMDKGVKSENISQVDLCTHCEENLFSYRRAQQKDGRLLSFIGITPS